MLSLAGGCALEWELWLGGLFTAAELAAAELLMQLRWGETEAAASTTTSPSCCEDLAVVEEERVFKATAAVSLGSMELDWCTRKISANSCCADEEKLIVKESASPLASMELDRRARKRYRLLSEIYAATRPAKVAAAKKKRKRHHDGGESESSWEEEAARHGGRR